MRCDKCGDINLTVALVMGCKTCNEDGTANELRPFEGLSLETAVAMKPQLANRFIPQAAVAVETTIERTQEEQDAVDEANRLVEQRRTADAEAFAKQRDAQIAAGGGEFAGAGAQTSWNEPSKPEEQTIVQDETWTVESVVGAAAGAPAAEAGQVDQGATAAQAGDA